VAIGANLFMSCGSIVDAVKLLWLASMTLMWWLGGSVVWALDTRLKDPRFNAQPMRNQVTVLGK